MSYHSRISLQIANIMGSPTTTTCELCTYDRNNCPLLTLYTGQHSLRGLVVDHITACGWSHNSLWLITSQLVVDHITACGWSHHSSQSAITCQNVTAMSMVPWPPERLRCLGTIWVYTISVSGSSPTLAYQGSQKGLLNLHFWVSWTHTMEVT